MKREIKTVYGFQIPNRVYKVQIIKLLNCNSERKLMSYFNLDGCWVIAPAIISIFFPSHLILYFFFNS